MGKIKYFENKDYIVNSDNGKQFRILESDLLFFLKSYNYKKNDLYEIEDFNKYMDLINDTKPYFVYDDISLNQELKISFDQMIYDGSKLISFGDYKDNIEKYIDYKFDIYLHNNRYNYSFKVGTIKYYKNARSYSLFLEIECNFNLNEFILDFSKYVLGMNDRNGNFENFSWD